MEKEHSKKTAGELPRKLEEICETAGMPREVFLSYVEKEWIHKPLSSESEWREGEWNEEDLRRARLISELQNDFGVNEESVPIILHLVDQLNALQRILRQLDLENVAEISLSRSERKAI